MPNIFDRFDPSAPTAAPRNVFDQFDVTPPPGTVVNAPSPVQAAAQSMGAAEASFGGQPRQPELRAYEPSWRDRLAQLLMPDERASPLREKAVEALVGSRGIGRTSTIPAVDFTPLGLLLAGDEMHRSAEEGDVIGTVANAAAMIPAPGVSPMMKAARSALPSVAPEIVRDAQAFSTLGVRPFGPAFSQGPVASVAKQLSDTPVIGAPVRNALTESLEGTARASRDVAGRFGTAERPDQAGEAVREGIERFRDARPTDVVEREAGGFTPEQRKEIISTPVRETSLKTKQAALYEDAWSEIPEEMRQGRTVKGLPRVLGDLPETRAVINDISDRQLGMLNKGRAERLSVRDETSELLPTRGEAIPKVALPVRGGLLGQIVEDIAAGNWRGALQNMRDIRSDFRRLASGMADTEKNTLRLSDLERIQSSLTNDMVGLLRRNVSEYRRLGDTKTADAMERAIRKFRRADQFTRTAMQRMEAIEKLFNADSVESLYRSVKNSALGRGRGDLQKLRVLRKTLRDDEWGDVASAVIRQLGEPTGSTRDVAERIGFSVESFMTNWNNMSPEAKGILFGGEHKAALEDMARVARRLANVEALANRSRSGTNTLNLSALLGAGGAMFAGADAFMTALGTAGAGLAASVLFSRPQYVRWATKYAVLRSRVLSGQPGQVNAAAALNAHVGRLAQMAKDDPQLEQVVRLVADGNVRGEEKNGPEKP